MRNILTRLSKLQQKAATNIFRILRFDGTRYHTEDIPLCRTRQPGSNHTEAIDSLCHNLNNPVPNRNIRDFTEEREGADG